MVEGGVLVGKAGRMGSASCPIPPASTSGRRTRWRLPCPCVPIGRTRAHSNANQESGGELALARIPYHDYRPERYDEIFRDKVREIEESFGSMLSGVEVTAQASAPTHFRLRCRFAVSASVDRDTGETRLVHTLFDRGADRVEVSSFPIASRQINDLMPRLMRHLEGLEGEAAAQVRDGLDAVHYLGTMRGRDVVVTLIYGRPIQGEGWKREVTKLAEELGVSVVGRSKGVKLVAGRDYVVERMAVGGRDVTWKQVEGSFSNPNGGICKDTMDHICELCEQISSREGREGDLLDLYCGNGNYTVPLSRLFGRVLSVEINDRLVEAARENMEQNGVDNVTLVRSDCLKFSAGLRARAGPEHKCASRFDFSTILVDPPRAGLDPNTLEVASRFRNVLYISCNADTLRTCLRALLRTHDLRSFRVFDHFPYTKYSECVVHLERKEAGGRANRV
ncbi:tRNA/tmRNA (uracil-C(5))-methyltransferase [Chloropicon roscoffensis]|uniref:tRNA/tmRNA (Uracil-C(5))-methyltransferase n=1 Tax=Chloropicon roscoffensis TaxID=1461544 RepID=A0AAX4P143_9CHLO